MTTAIALAGPAPEDHEYGRRADVRTEDDGAPERLGRRRLRTAGLTLAGEVGGLLLPAVLVLNDPGQGAWVLGAIAAPVFGTVGVVVPAVLTSDPRYRAQAGVGAGLTWAGGVTASAVAFDPGGGLIGPWLPVWTATLAAPPVVAAFVGHRRQNDTPISVVPTQHGVALVGAL